jgi:hypothetical protein
MPTLSESVNKAIEGGYTENFRVVRQALITQDGKSIYHPNDVAIPDFYRFEGNSDPDYSSILYLIETNDGRRGLMIDAYGAYADAEVSDFIRQVENIRKKAYVL